MPEPEGASEASRRRRHWNDAIFFLIMGGLSGSFILLIVLLLLADLMFTSPRAFFDALAKPEIRASFWLTIASSTTATILSLWVAIPLGYLLSRFKFPGRPVVDTLVDMPLVLPPLVLGISLLILFNQPFPILNLFYPDSNASLETWLRNSLGLSVTFSWPAVVLAQFVVASAFAVRTMRVTFDQISERGEDVARTLGASRAQVFLKVALPQAWRGVVTAGTIAWARSLGEFGPILVFAGATRYKTEVLSTSVYLELSFGQLDAAVAVSLLMVAMAILVLLILRWFGTGLST